MRLVQTLLLLWTFLTSYALAGDAASSKAKYNYQVCVQLRKFELRADHPLE
jgi:hypothetical protein